LTDGQKVKVKFDQPEQLSQWILCFASNRPVVVEKKAPDVDLTLLNEQAVLKSQKTKERLAKEQFIKD
jgi:hypothetical protein